MSPKKTNYFIYAAAISVNLLSFGLGSAFSWTSPVLTKLKTSDSAINPLGTAITATEEAWITSLLSLGAALGPILSGCSADRFGRKKTLLFFSLFMLLPYLITAFASKVELFYIARFLIGISCGCAFSITPIYLGEIAQVNNRGLLSCLICVLLTSGTLFSYAVGPYTSIQTLSLLCMIPIVVFMITFGIFIPESPYYYIMVKQDELAEKALKQLRQEDDVRILREELNDLRRSIAESTANQRIPIKWRSLLISLGLMFFQQFSGISVILGYMQSIFDATGSTLPSDISSIIIGSLQVVVSFLTSQLVDRLGRRILLLTSIAGISVSLLVLGTYFHLKDNEYNVDSLYALPVVCLVVYIVAYNFGIGPLAWAMLGELFPVNAKATASAITTFFCLMLAFLTSMFFPHFLLMFGIATAFWLFGGVSIVGIVFVAVIVPETKGKSFDEIQRQLTK